MGGDIIPRRRTQEEFDTIVKDLVGEEYTFLEGYRNNCEKTEVIHNTCGYRYGVRPKDFIRGNRCLRCFRANQRRSPETYREDFDTIMGNDYVLLSEYTHSREPIKFLHVPCGRAVMRRADNLYQSCMGCLYCTNKGFTKSHEEFVSQVTTRYGNIYEVLGEYVNNKTPIRIRHNVCGKVTRMAPNNLLRAKNHSSCGYCSQSSGEQAVKRALESIGAEFTEQKSFSDLRSNKGYPYRYDFYVAESKLIIEYHGRQRYVPIEFIGGEKTLMKRQEADRIKREYALGKGYKYLEIHYQTPLEDIETIIKDKLLV